MRKLILINILWQGRRYSKFVFGTLRSDGTSGVNEQDIQDFIKEIGIPRGHCIGIGA